MKLFSLTFSIVLLIFLAGCSKDKDSYKNYPRPEWVVATPEAYPNSFSAIVSIPGNINTYSEDTDIVAAFIGDECRGVGNLVKSEDGTKRVYYITIRASDTENRNIVFRYYSSRLTYLYQAKTQVAFEIDGTYGTYDSPVILDLEQI
ncbi:MAG TPA: hypothetical protein VMV47_19360 [Bacteroidales bacterium]|nr:hypothetical protein [Bacteroidales bacterium]